MSLLHLSVQSVLDDGVLHHDFRVLEGHLQQGEDYFVNGLEGDLVIEPQMGHSYDGGRVLGAKQPLGEIAKLEHARVLFKPGIRVPSHLVERIIIVAIAHVFEQVLLVRYYQNFVKWIELGWFLMKYVEFSVHHLVVNLALMHSVIQKYLRHIVLDLVHKIIVVILKIPN